MPSSSSPDLQHAENEQRQLRGVGDQGAGNEAEDDEEDNQSARAHQMAQGNPDSPPLSVAKPFFIREERTGTIAIRPFYTNRSSEPNFPFFLGKTARIQKKEGFIRTPSNRYGPSSSLSNFNFSAS